MGAAFARKYNTLLVTGTTAIRIPLIKRGVVDFAVGADYTPSAGDVKVHIDGAAAANITNLPTAIASGNTAFWEFILTAAELTSKQTHVSIADSATKVIEDQAFIIETFGNASAMYAADLSLANLPANVAQWNGTAVATPATAGVPDINVKNVNNVAATSVTTVNANLGTTQPVNFTGTGASALVKTDTVDWAGTAVATPDTAGYVKATIKDGTGTGELDTTSGKVALKDASFGTATLDGTFVFLDEDVLAAKIGDLDLSAHTDPGSLGQVLQDVNVDTFNTAAAVDTEIAAIKAVTDQFVFGTANRVNVQVYGMQSSVIDAAAIATDAITAAKIATNAIDADALAADAIAEINATVDTALADYDAPTSAEMVARTLAAAAYATATATATLQTSVDDIPTNAELTTALATADDATLAAIAALNNLSQANVRSAVGLGSANLDTQLDALPTNTELATALGTADDAVLTRLGTPTGASIAADIAAIEAQTDDIGIAGAGLTAVPWNPSWDTEVQSEATDALNAYDPPTSAELDTAVLPLTNLDATVSSRATPAQVNAQMLDVLVTDTFAEPSAVPAAAASLKDKIGYLMLKARNKRTQTATQARVYADDGTTVVGTSSTSDDGTTFTSGEDA